MISADKARELAKVKYISIDEISKAIKTAAIEGERVVMLRGEIEKQTGRKIIAEGYDLYPGDETITIRW